MCSVGSADDDREQGTDEAPDDPDRAAALGALTGLVALGVGSRGAMRIVALTSGQIGTSVRPESGAVPGTITPDGTAFLLMAGTVFGTVLGVGVVAGLGRWMPAARWLRLGTSVLLAAVLPAVVLLDPGNVDFRLFGPRWVAVTLFAAVPLTFGVLVTLLAEQWSTPRVTTPGPIATFRRAGRLLAGVAAILLLGAGGIGAGSGAGLAASVVVAATLLGVGLAEHDTSSPRRAADRIGRVLVLAAAAVAGIAVVVRIVQVALA